jgi:hypothetical protein
VTYLLASIALAGGVGGFLCGCSQLGSRSIHQPRITSVIEFSSATLTGSVPKTELATLWNAKLKIGAEDPDAYKFLTISTNGRQTKLRVETCAEYTNAIQQASYSLTTADMATESWFVRAAGTLRFIESAKPSTHPLPDFLARLPVSVLGWSGSDEETQINDDTRKGLTLKDYARSGKVQHLNRNGHLLAFSTAFQDYSIEELGRGDLNGDKVEDALLFVTWHYREGSGRAYELYLVAKSRNGPILLKGRIGAR